MNKYIPVIGLEVHVELKTKSKMFCRCSNDYFSEEPNTHTCPVCLGLPGALPVPNKKAIEWCIMIGLALNCEIPLVSKFDRKNYFYPDLAKGYQISQYDQPFAINGNVVIASEAKQSQDHGIATSPLAPRNDKGRVIRIRRVHMEEDTGKLSHQELNGEKVSLIDFNRSGVPLVEIVTEPDFTDAKQVVKYLQKLQKIVRYLNVSNADMEKGEMRLEPNISLALNPPQPSFSKGGGGMISLPNYKVEVKNINSFKFVEKAITYELKRQEAILEEGKTPVQETRGWDENKQKTFSQRVKEEAQDYRYFPEPDIPPIHWSKEQISALKAFLPELPDQKVARLQSEFGLTPYDAEILTREISVADYFEKAVNEGQRAKGKGKVEEKDISNWIINRKVDINNVSPTDLVKKILSAKITIVVDEEELKKVISEVLKENPKAVDDYRKGKQASLMFLLGQVMRKLGKKVDTNIVRSTIEKELGK